MNKTAVSAVLIGALFTVGLAQTPKTPATPLDAAKPTADEKKKIQAVDDEYVPKYLELRQHPSENRDALWELNQEYTKSLLETLTRDQQVAYLEAVYRTTTAYLTKHPTMKRESVFMWGGAFSIKPKGE